MQKLSWSVFVGGALLFLTALGHELTVHSTWSSLIATPQTAGDLLIQLATAGAMVAGALGIDLRH